MWKNAPRHALALTLAVLAAPALAEEAPSLRAPRNPRRTPVVEAVEKAAPAVVSIGTTRIVKYRYYAWVQQQEQRGLGSGVIVHPSGYVVTNAHVINQADEILVKLTGSREGEPDIPATLIAEDLDHDLALLRLEKPGPYPSVEFGRSNDLMLGETVIAIGNPFGLGRTVTTGIVSALDRTLDVRDSKFTGFIQTDAAVNRGNSGGPLLNIAGDWIGVNSAIYSLSGGSDGISFAIPVDAVRQFVTRSLRSTRVNGAWLGLELGERQSGAVYVQKVYPDGPAARAGVLTGSEVRACSEVRAAGLLPVCFTMLDASRRGSIRLELAPPAGKPQVVTVPFEPLSAGALVDKLAWERLGLRCAEVDEKESRETRYPVGALVVEELRAGGPADRVGVAKGDLLVTIGNAQIAGAEDLLEFMLEEERGAVRELKFLRPTRTRAGMNLKSWKGRIVVE